MSTDERHDRGFTLVEILIVIVVLGILSGIVVFGVGRFRSDATAAACKADLATVGVAADAYDATTGSFPTSVDMLVAGKYLKAAPGTGTYTFTAATRTVTREPACAGGLGAPVSTTARLTGGSGKCIDLAGGSTDDGTVLVLGTCDGRVAQRWTAPPSWPGAITVLGRCMDVAGGGTDNRTAVQFYGCNGSGAQVWNLQAGGVLVNPQSGRCLDAEGAGTADGTRLIIWDCHGQANQQWAFTP